MSVEKGYSPGKDEENFSRRDFLKFMGKAAVVATGTALGASEYVKHRENKLTKELVEGPTTTGTIDSDGLWGLHEKSGYGDFQYEDYKRAVYELNNIPEGTKESELEGRDLKLPVKEKAE